MIESLHIEREGSGLPQRKLIVRQLDMLIAKKRKESDIKRATFFKPDFSSVSNYVRSMEIYRHKLCSMLGWPMHPKPDNLPFPSVKVISTHKDCLGTIVRMQIQTLPELMRYGILFIPKGNGPFPLVISLHGGGGTPERCSGLWGSSSNYNDMTRRILRRGCVVFTPQLLLWNDNLKPKLRREELNRSFIQFGGSIASLEIFMITRCIDYLITRPEISPDKIGIVGLSYGGFYSLFTSALDTRIKVTLSSCFFNDRHIYNWHDLVWLNSANLFFDAEVAQLVCPRHLYIEVGKKDELFDVKRAGIEALKVSAAYRAIKMTERFKYKEFDGTHELDKCDDGIEFLGSFLK